MITKNRSNNIKNSEIKNPNNQSDQKTGIIQKYSEKLTEIFKSFFLNDDNNKNNNNSPTKITLGQNFLNETKNNPYAERLEQFKIKDIKKATEKDLHQGRRRNPKKFEVKSSSGLAAKGLNKEK